MLCCASKAKSNFSNSPHFLILLKHIDHNYDNCLTEEVEQDGTLTGEITKIDSNMLNKPIIKIFEERVKNGKIHEKKTAIHHGDHIILTYVQVSNISTQVTICSPNYSGFANCPFYILVKYHCFMSGQKSN